jgi:hypothetical protein
VFDNSPRILNSQKPFFCLFYAFYWFRDKSQHNAMIDLIRHGVHYREHYFDAALKVGESRKEKERVEVELIL